MVDEKLIKLQHFFEVDLKIKKEMLNMNPLIDTQYMNESSIIKYTDRVYDSLIYISSIG